MSYSLSANSRDALPVATYGLMNVVSGMATGFMLIGSPPIGALYGAVKFVTAICLTDFCEIRLVPSTTTAKKVFYIVAPMLAGLAAMFLVGVSLPPLTALGFTVVQEVLVFGSINFIRSLYL